jgi:hypothetical protein
LRVKDGSAAPIGGGFILRGVFGVFGDKKSAPTAGRAVADLDGDCVAPLEARLAQGFGAMVPLGDLGALSPYCPTK